MPTWPASVPSRVLADSLNVAPQAQFIRSSMDVGPAKQRRRTSVAVTNLGTLSALVTGRELAAFRTWYDGDLAGGSLSFSWTDKTTDATSTFRFTAPPSWQLARADDVAALRLWRLALPLEIVP